MVEEQKRDDVIVEITVLRFQHSRRVMVCVPDGQDLSEGLIVSSPFRRPTAACCVFALRRRICSVWTFQHLMKVRGATGSMPVPKTCLSAVEASAPGNILKEV